MKNLLMFVIVISAVVFFVNYSHSSANVRSQSAKAERTIADAAAIFLDTVADSGAITSREYARLQSALAGTGGAFSTVITVTRLYPIPDPNLANNYIMDYRPAYGWSSDQGGISDSYVDPNWQVALYGLPPRGVQYLVKADSVSVIIRQTDAMPYQRTMVARLGTVTNLGVWSYSKAVRDSGNSIVGNQPEPLR